MPTSFACPACRSVLKTKVEVPAGKKVKCPKCANIFAAPAADVKASAAVRSGAPAGSPVGARTDVRSGKPAATARRPAPPADDDEDERRDRKRSKKRKKKKPSNMPLLLGIGGGAGALIGVVVILGFVWPGLFLGKEKTRKAQPVVQEVAKNADGLPKGTGQEELVNFVPAGCNAFAGMDLSVVHQDPEMQQKWPMVAGMIQSLPGAPPGLADIIADIDRVLVAVNTNEKTGPGGEVNPEGVLIVRMKSPYTKEKILQLLKDGKEPVQKSGKTVYLPEGTKETMEPVPMVYMHNDRVLIVVGAPSQRLEKMLEFDGVKSSTSPQALIEIRAVDKAFLWAAVEVTPTVQEYLAKIDPQALANMGPELQPALAPFQKIKSASFALEVSQNPKSIKLRVAATCASESDGQQLQSALSDFWEKKGKSYLASVKMFIPPNVAPAIEPILSDVTNNLTVTAQGPQVSVALEISAQAIQALEAQSNQLQQMFGAGRRPSGPGMQPGQPPGRQPPAPRGRQPRGRAPRQSSSPG